MNFLDELSEEIIKDYRRNFNKYLKDSVEKETNLEVKNLTIQQIQDHWKDKMEEREKIYVLTEIAKVALYRVLTDYKKFGNPAEIPEFEETTGLYLLKSDRNKEAVRGLSDGGGKYAFEVHSFRPARRIGPDGNMLNQVIISITQKRRLPIDKNIDLEKFVALSDEEKDNIPQFNFRGGCTLILDLKDLTLRYAISKSIGDKLDKNFKYAGSNERLKRQREFRFGSGGAGKSLRATYFGKAGDNDTDEPFAILHGRL